MVSFDPIENVVSAMVCVTSVYLWRVKRLYQKSDVVIFWPKLCITGPPLTCFKHPVLWNGHPVMRLRPSRWRPCEEQLSNDNLLQHVYNECTYYWSIVTPFWIWIYSLLFGFTNSFLLYSNLMWQMPRYYKPPFSREKIRMVPTTRGVRFRHFLNPVQSEVQTYAGPRLTC